MTDGLPGRPDRFLDGRMALLQLERGHRAGTDSLLLSAFAPGGGRVCDLGAGVGAVGIAMMLTGRAERLSLVEREPELAALAGANIGLNGLEERASVAAVDVFAGHAARRAAGLENGGFEVVVTNPPFDDVAGRQSPDPLRRRAHAMEGGDLAGWLKVAAALLAEGGHLAAIHRADRLAEVLAAMPRGLGGITLRPVQSKGDQPAIRILVRARKGSRAPLSLLPSLTLHKGDGTFTPEAAWIHRVGTGFSPR